MKRPIFLLCLLMAGQSFCQERTKDRKPLNDILVNVVTGIISKPSAETEATVRIAAIQSKVFLQIKYPDLDFANMISQMVTDPVDFIVADPLCQPK